MKQNEYPVAPFSNETYLLGYEASNPKLTRNYNASDISGGGGLNIYNSNGTLVGVGDRTIDQAGKKLILLNGNMYVGTTGLTGGLFKLEVSSTNGGIVVFSTTGSSFNGNTTDGRLFTGTTVNGAGVGVMAPYNEFYDFGNPTSVLPTSVLAEFRSKTKGILTTRMTYNQRVAIVSPEPWLIVVQTDTSGMSLKGAYINHPDTGWDRFVLASE